MKAPNARRHEHKLKLANVDPLQYQRELFGKLRAMGIQQHVTAKELGITPRMIRMYATEGDPVLAPYTVIYALQQMVILEGRKLKARMEKAA